MAIPPVDLSIMTIPFDKPPPLGSNPPPTNAIIRELDFKPEGNELWFYFSRWSHDVPVQDTSDLGALIDKICDPGYDWDHDAPSYPPNISEY